MPEKEVIIKRVEPMLVAGLRRNIPNRQVISATLTGMFDELYDHVNKFEHEYTGAWLDVWYDMEHKEADMDVEACAPLARPVPESDGIKMHELPGVDTMACVIHTGPFTGLESTFDSIIKWIDANGYRIVGPSREVYLEYSRDADPETYVTEVQFPVAKA